MSEECIECFFLEPVAISNAIIFQDGENIVLDCQEEDNSLLLETVKAVI